MAFLKHKSIFKVIPKRANKSTTKILTHLKRAKTFECTTNNLTHSICYTRWMKIANEKFQPLAGRLSRRVDSGQAKTKQKKTGKQDVDRINIQWAWTIVQQNKFKSTVRRRKLWSATVSALHSVSMSRLCAFYNETEQQLAEWKNARSILRPYVVPVLSITVISSIPRSICIWPFIYQSQFRHKIC